MHVGCAMQRDKWQTSGKKREEDGWQALYPKAINRTLREKEQVVSTDLHCEALRCSHAFVAMRLKGRSGREREQEILESKILAKCWRSPCVVVDSRRLVSWSSYPRWWISNPDGGRNTLEPCVQVTLRWGQLCVEVDASKTDMCWSHPVLKTEWSGRDESSSARWKDMRSK